MRKAGKARYIHISCGKNKSALFVEAWEPGLPAVWKKNIASFFVECGLPAAGIRGRGRERVFIEHLSVPSHCVTCLI